MDLGISFVDFLQRIAVGAGTVFAVLLVIRVRISRRSVIAARRRTTD
jgi:hypothetical protein